MCIITLMMKMFRKPLNWLFARFLYPAHRIIYESVVALSQRSERIDLITLQNELEKQHVWNQ